MKAKPDENVFQGVTRVLSCDPGKTNFAMVVFDVSDTKLFSLLNDINTAKTKKSIPITIRTVGLLSDFLNMEKYNPGFENLINIFSNWINTYKPDCVFSERFQGRGMKGDLHEVCISAATILSTIARVDNTNCYVDVVSALKWKNVIGNTRLNNLYELTKNYKHVKVHHVDALMLGYYLYTINNIKLKTPAIMFQWLTYLEMSEHLLGAMDTSLANKQLHNIRP